MTSTTATANIFQSEAMDKNGEIVGRLEISLTGEHSAEGVAAQLRSLADEIDKVGIQGAFPGLPTEAASDSFDRELDFLADDRSIPPRHAAEIGEQAERIAGDRSNPTRLAAAAQFVASLRGTS
jgi:hypothetical protein